MRICCAAVRRSLISTNKNSNQANLGQGSKVVGKVSFTGPAELTGVVEGEIEARDLLEIGESAEIKATINGTEVVVRGTVHGDIIASGKLSLLQPARVYGNIQSSNLKIEEGVVFEGSCTMSKKKDATLALKKA